MRKTGIMGGTFNPIHNGHLRLAREAYRQLALDEVLFMPSGRPYMKSEREVADARIRAEMTMLAIQDIPYFRFSPMEIEQQGNTYTYQTLERLRREHPDTAYFFITGADTLFQMSEWVSPERVFANCTVAAAVRDDKNADAVKERIGLLERQYGADIVLLKTERMNLSSSEIRRRRAAGESIAGEVPERVRVYIEEEGLYR